MQPLTPFIRRVPQGSTDWLMKRSFKTSYAFNFHNAVVHPTNQINPKNPGLTMMQQQPKRQRIIGFELARAYPI